MQCARADGAQSGSAQRHERDPGDDQRGTGGTAPAHGLTLLALERAPAPPVAALRETSILIAVAWAALKMREPVGVRRAAGASLVVAGVALVTLG